MMYLSRVVAVWYTICRPTLFTAVRYQELRHGIASFFRKALPALHKGKPEDIKSFPRVWMLACDVCRFDANAPQGVPF